MAVGIGAGGYLGFAFESTVNTYVAPTKFAPIRNEDLKYVQETKWRRNIRAGVVEPIAGVAGNVHVEGDIEIEALPDVVAYFLYAGRTTVTKTGAGPYTYAVVGNGSAVATTLRTLSITVVRAGVVFGYVGCVVSNFSFSIDEGALIMKMSILGSDEAVQSVPVATFANQNTFGAGQYSIQIPTATTVFDMDEFTFEVEDNGESQFRLKNTGRGAQFIKFGEREAHMTAMRDFDGRTEYDAFKALTASTVTIVASQGASASITFLLPAATKADYVVGGLANQGDLIRVEIDYKGIYDATTGAAYKITVVTTENIS